MTDRFRNQLEPIFVVPLLLSLNLDPLAAAVELAELPADAARPKQHLVGH